jgi:hypothetical protein
MDIIYKDNHWRDFSMSEIKFILNGMPVRRLAEGAFSDIQIELMERIEDLVQKVERVGDFQFGNSLNPNYTNIKIDFDDLIRKLDKYDLQAAQFVEQTVKTNPNITYLEMLALIKEKFL